MRTRRPLSATLVAVNIACPKCGFEEPENRRECSRCGIVFGKYNSADVEPPLRRLESRLRADSTSEDTVLDGRVGPGELRTLGIGLLLAIVVYAIPFTRFVFSAMVTLFHELGHAVMGWLMGMPAIPAFDFVYGGGITPHTAFQPVLALVIAGGFVYLMWLFRQNRKTLVLIGAIFLVWLFFVSADWRREFAFGAAGHLAECILAGILFYQALSGVGWRIPELERPLGAFIAFFVQIHMIFFCWKLMHDPDFLAWYREGKGGMLMNDLEGIALDLHIHTPFNPGIEGVARLLLLFSFLPIVTALIWYFQRARWHRMLRALSTATI
jgi:hypothetical protein